MDNLSTSLWFDSQAEEAAAFYCSVFDGEITEVTPYPEGGMGEPGSVMTVDFTAAGMAFTALNGGPQFTFNEAVSIQVPCSGQDEIDHYWAALSEGGEQGPCGWLRDRYGLSWQVFDQRAMSRLLHGDPDGARRAMQAMLTMGKIDLAVMDRAYAGD